MTTKAAARTGGMVQMIAWMAAAVLPWAYSAAQAENEPNSRPNIVFIMVDDLGWADIGAYGQKVVPTPNLDRLAAEGMRFTNAYAGCSHCAPSRSVLMTGLHMGHTPLRINPGGASIRGRSVGSTPRANG